MKLFRSLLPLYLLVMGLFFGAAALGSHAVTAVAEHPDFERDVVFIIDAGHGGEDGGTVSCTGVHESVLNLEIAKRLHSLLRLLGRETVMTRTTSQALSTQGSTIAARKLSDLKNRVALVRQIPAGILVSIHQNQFSDPQYAGPQVFFGSQTGSRELACFLQQALNDGLGIKKGRAARAVGKVYLMQRIPRTAVLLECGFLSNPREEALLRSDAYQLRLCAVAATALTRYADA